MWSPFFCPGDWSVIVLPPTLFFAPSAELALAMAGCDVIVYGESHMIRACFHKGVRDFLKEPWGVDELVARAFERSPQQPIKWGGASGWILQGTRLVGPRGEVKLTIQQRAILSFLAERQGWPVSTVALEQLLYPSGVRPASRVLASAVSQLRAQIRKVLSGSEPCVIESVRGVGYRLP